MRELFVIVGPLVLVLLVAAWPPSPTTHESGTPAATDSPPRARHSAASVRAYRWITSEAEARWHIAAPGTRATRTACGHRPRGTVHSHLGTRVPGSDRRSVCAACCHTARVPLDRTHRATDPRRSPTPPSETPRFVPPQPTPSSRERDLARLLDPSAEETCTGRHRLGEPWDLYELPTGITIELSSSGRIPAAAA